MRIVWLSIALVLAVVSGAQAQTATLSPAVTLSVPTAGKLQITDIVIRPVQQSMTITYKWLTAADAEIQKAGTSTTSYTYTFQNIPAELVANCVSAGSPYAGCTGPGTGTGLFPGDTGFTDVFGFTIRAQDVGTKLGIGMRNLIVAKMKAAIPQLSGVTITFAD